MTFGGGFNFSGHARGWLKVDKGNYLCIEAKDVLHTLRSCADIECIDNAWGATFKGDSEIGGNGLLGGNLDCWKPGGNANVIDVLDAGVYLGIIAGNAGALWPGSHTDCGQPGPDGDINADGHVDSADYSFILENFLAERKDCCCPDSQAAAEFAVTRISAKALRARGLGDLMVGDLNGDGFLDTVDMALYMEGVNPVSVQLDSKRMDTGR